MLDVLIVLACCMLGVILVCCVQSYRGPKRKSTQPAPVADQMQGLG